jgi:hypothetical protein
LVDKLIDDEYKRPEKLRNEIDIQYGIRLKEWSIQRMRRLEHARALYHYIILHLQDDSAAKLAATPQWPTISSTFNPIALWILIESTHIGGESNLANKAKLRGLKATYFASYEEYTTAVLFLIRDITLGRGLVDQQEISYYVLQGTKALLGESHPEITKYNVAASTSTLPDYNHLLRDFGQFIRATPNLYRTTQKTQPSPMASQESLSNDPNMALVATKTDYKWCDIHRAKSHNTAECKLLPAIWEHFKLRDPQKRNQKGDSAEAYTVRTLGDVLDDLNGLGSEYENLALDLSDNA